MAAHISIADPTLGRAESGIGESLPSYWNAENHSASEGNVYLRAEEWLQDLSSFTLPVKHTTVKVTHEMGIALMRYREELKMYAAIRDQDLAGTRAPLSMETTEFLNERHRLMKEEWPGGKQRGEWWKALEELRLKLDEVIRSFPDGAFVKFSVRSPKDAAAVMPSYLHLLQSHIEKSEVHPDAKEALGEDVSAIKYANWMALRCESGEDAILLFVRSERIYLDILQHELFCKGNVDKFDLTVHVFEFFKGVSCLL